MALLAAIFLEAYYIVGLRETITRQSDDLRKISVELQSLRTENTSLHDELTSTRRKRGEDTNDNTPDR